jgi:protein TonB
MMSGTLGIHQSCVLLMLLLCTAVGSAGASDTPAYDEPPKLVKKTRPKYPEAAFRDKLEGTVVVEIMIDDRGNVQDATVATSNPAFDQAALESVKKWRFKPARKDGKAVATRARVPVVFRIF